ncbi:histidine phosphatase family protein [Corynebacterium falsenii]|nr:histidine phosphatase family protein [Corynebacterium falsenii]
MEKPTASAETHTVPSAAPAWHGGARPTRFLLLRHGQTAMSVQGQYSGLSNPALTEHGEQQAARAARYLAAHGNIEAIVASPLHRCQQTAQAAAAALGIPDAVRTHEGLVEMDFGDWEGKTFGEVRDEYPSDRATCLTDITAKPHGGESPEEVYQRVCPVIDELTEEYPGANVLLVSHVTPIKSILRYALGCSGTIYRGLHLDLAGLSVVEFYPEHQAVIRLVNDTHYLR